MASADPRDEMKCSICLNIYMDPVKLTCGHNFCQVCIDRELDAQKGSGFYSCPQCRKRSRTRPTLQRNITLQNKVKAFQTTQPGREKQVENRILCTYCIHSPVPAVKSCLICEASLCEDHLGVHSKSPDHVLCDPTTSMENRKCSVHKELLKYFCPADSSCICVSCSLAGDHREHQVETLDEASEKKKQKLRNVLQKLTTKREETDKRVRSLQEHKKKVQEKAAGVAERVTALFRDLRRGLEDLEKKVLSEISGRAEGVSLSLSDQIQELEIKKEELSRKMGHIEELCTMTDPLTLLQESGDLRDPEHGDNGRPQLPHDGGNLDMAGISHTLQAGLSVMMSGINLYFNIWEAPDALLDIYRAHNSLQMNPNPQGIVQELSTRGFSSGRQYWDVNVQQPEWWIVGVCYPSMERGGVQGVIGSNNKSWGLHRYKNECSVIHDNNKIWLSDNVLSNRVRVYLDYEVGQISFYDLCDPIRHLYTFTTIFTEPLHAALALWRGQIITPVVSRGL